MTAETLPCRGRPQASFNDLPLELREEIWKLTLTPRIVYLYAIPQVSIEARPSPYRATPNKYLTVLGLSFIGRVRTPTHGHAEDYLRTSGIRTNALGYIPPKSSPGPVALHVCTESRAIAMRSYEPAFESMANGEGTPLSGSKIWVDFERDVLCFDEYFDVRPSQELTYDVLRGSLEVFAAKELTKIRKLAMCHVTLRTIFEISPTSSGTFGLETKAFTKLEELHLCPHALWHPVYPSLPMWWNELPEREGKRAILKDYLKMKDVDEFKRAYGEIC